ncbi:DUF2306 domain-containing protein [Citricoccus sp. GCM10030269]|uniref:DUF2306 domain-containing protein n=1 Tax=Citricoccus sp. GCM10030269 TaxID=3273388 RepID=UPI003622F860
MDPVSDLVSDPLLLIHVLAAVLSLALPPVNLIRRRRDHLHRRVGRTWVVTMVITALTSFTIQEPFWNLSWLHALSVWTVLSLSLGVAAIRRGNKPAHIAHMVGSYFGLWVAFLWAAIVPNRTVAQILVQAPTTAVVTVLLAALTAVGLIWIYRTAPVRGPLIPPEVRDTPPSAATAGPDEHGHVGGRVTRYRATLRGR